MRMRHAVGVTVASVLTTLLAVNASAQSVPQGSNTQIQSIQTEINALQNQLQQLKGNLDQTNQQLKTSQEQTKQAQADAQRAQAEAKKVAATDPIVTFPNNRPTIGNKDASLAIGAQVQFDMGGYFQNNNSNDIQPAGARDLNTGSNLRRARLYVVGKYKDWTLNLTPDFGGSPDGSVSLYEANINYTWNPVTATVGFFKPWYSLQDSMSSSDFLFMERPSIVEIARNVAAGDARASIGGKANGDQWFASAYLTGGNWGDQTGTALLNEEQLGAVARLAGRPLYGEDWNLHVGFSGSYLAQPGKSNVDQDGPSSHNIQLRDRPELRIDMNRLIDTGPIDTDHADTWGFELGGNWRNLLLQGEYIRIDVDRRSDSDVHFQGGYVEGSWVITGEQRKYVPGAAAWARPVPAHPFDPVDGERGWGAWELAARYSLTDLDNKDINGGNQKVAGLSLSWYPNSLLRFILQSDHVDVDRENNAGTQIGQKFWDVALRSQIAF